MPGALHTALHYTLHTALTDTSLCEYLSFRTTKSILLQYIIYIYIYIYIYINISILTGYEMTGTLIPFTDLCEFPSDADSPTDTVVSDEKGSQRPAPEVPESKDVNVRPHPLK